MLEARQDRIRNLIQKRQAHFTVILENVRDPHNIGAVMRTCDAVGIREIFLIYPEEEGREQFALGKRASSGARKWVDVYEFNDLQTGFEFVKNKGYDQIWATKIVQDSKDLYEVDFTQRIALLFGNEHFGVSDEAAAYANGNFIIPQAGMVQSLNISVACAVTLYEGFRQRYLKGFYTSNPTIPTEEQNAMFDQYAERERLRIKGKHSIKIDRSGT